jgi:hypothetical protein
MSGKGEKNHKWTLVKVTEEAKDAKFEPKGCYADKPERAIGELAGKGFCGEEGRQRC